MSETEPLKSTEPFCFYTRLNLSELTGRKARNLKDLVTYLKSASEAVIYYHTHHYLQEHHYLSPEPPNDFAYWVKAALNENELSEKLSSINTIEFSNLNDLRNNIVETIEKHIAKTKDKLRDANEGQELYFLKSVSFILPTRYQASSLEEFVTKLEKVTIESLYFHMFDTRIYHARGGNDFSLWLEHSLGETELAKQIARLDPYTYTLESLRTKIIMLVRERLKKVAHPV